MTVVGAGGACELCGEGLPRVVACSLAAAERSRRVLRTHPTGSFVGVRKGARGKSLYVMSELPTNFGFFAASDGCRGMRARQDSTHFPNTDACSPVRVMCDDPKKQESLHTPFR